eukprot:3232494-Amphidinium_carterae.1
MHEHDDEDADEDEQVLAHKTHRCTLQTPAIQVECLKLQRDNSDRIQQVPDWINPIDGQTC